MLAIMRDSAKKAPSILRCGFVNDFLEYDYKPNLQSKRRGTWKNNQQLWNVRSRIHGGKATSHMANRLARRFNGAGAVRT